MPEISAETALFFADHAEALPLYLAFLRGLSDVCPDPVCKVGKTQISLSHGGVFACVSFLRVKKKAEIRKLISVKPKTLISESVTISIRRISGKELWYLSRLPMTRQRLTCSILKRDLWSLH